MMADDEPIRALRRLGHDLQQVADRRYGEHRRRPGPARRRRALLILVGVLLAGAAAAGATQLISVGGPETDRPGFRTFQQPAGPTARSLVATAPDADAHGRWGVRAYRSHNGDSCALVGFLRGDVLGTVRGGMFHPYTSSVTGACGTPAPRRFFLSVSYVTEPRPRTLIYGRAGRQVAAVRVLVDGRPRDAPAGEAGAFLLVFAGRLDASALRPRPVYRP
jgi:hypothetical protein